MKLRYLIALTIIAVIAYFVYQDPKLNRELMDKVHQAAPGLNSSTLYKWKNSKGEWQVTDKPPASGIPFISINTSDQVNVIPAQPGKTKK